MSEFDLQSSEEFDPAVAVAIKTAIIVSTTFFFFVLLERFGFFPFRWNPISEAIFHTTIVIIVSRWILQWTLQKATKSKLSDHILFSTFFFYGSSLAFAYITKIVTIAGEFFFIRTEHISGALAFVVGVSDFSTASLVGGAFLSVFPYGAYYFSVRSAKE